MVHPTLKQIIDEIANREISEATADHCKVCQRCHQIVYRLGASSSLGYNPECCLTVGVFLVLMLDRSAHTLTANLLDDVYWHARTCSTCKLCLQVTRRWFIVYLMMGTGMSPEEIAFGYLISLTNHEQATVLAQGLSTANLDPEALYARRTNPYLN